MSFNRSKYEYFFPRKVFRCACLGPIIEKCCDHGYYSFTEIFDEISRNNFIDDDENKVFSVKCGDGNKDCLFACEKHVAIIIFAKKKFSCSDILSPINTTVTYSCGKKETFCIGCIKHYLKSIFHYFYFVNFDLKYS